MTTTGPDWRRIRGEGFIRKVTLGHITQLRRVMFLTQSGGMEADTNAGEWGHDDECLFTDMLHCSNSDARANFWKL